jgi:3-oxoacyl-[acyl-carrier-protein] synthase II
MGAVSCLGHGVEAMWQGLVAGRCGIRPLTRLRPSEHRIRHAGETPLRAEPSAWPLPEDLASRYALWAAAEAMRQAGLHRPKNVTLVLGSNFGAMATTERLLAGGGNKPGQSLADGPTDAVAVTLGIGGARSTISLSCASSNASIGYAADLIRSGQADVVLAGGYDAISEVVWAGLCSLRAMSARAVRPFDRRRDGTIFSEGAGALVLESAGHARRRGAKPLAELMGYATTSNAFHMTHPDADGAGMARAMRDALRDARLDPGDIDHINAHGTGTPPNDRLETRAIKDVFGARATEIPITGLKGMLGHAMGAAGILESIAAIETIRCGVIPPTVGLEEPDPECDLDYVPATARKTSVRTVLKNSAGFGGCNASVVFRQWSG